MTCAGCGHENREAAKFCRECAAPLVEAISCPQCGTPSERGQKFCDACGAGLAGRASRRAVGGEGNSPAGASPSRTSPVSYTPKHLADKILQSKSALEACPEPGRRGERKQVTVLFADVKGSMDLAEQLDPEEWSRIMQRFFRILSDGVERFEGFVDKFTGDGIMALFGAPIAHEDHAQRACYAALSLRDAIRRYADELRVNEGLNFSARIGLNSGEVVVGHIGDDLRMDYTAQGHTVGLASRMEQLAEPRSIYLTEHTAKLVAGYFQLRDLGPSRIKGVSSPLHIYELEGTGLLRTRLDVSRARGFSKFVGRHAEMAALDAALQRAIAAQGRVVGVVAEAGAGKSRLCDEFVQTCRAKGIIVRGSGGVAHGKSVPLLPVLQFYRATFGIGEHDDDRTARQKIAGSVVRLDEAMLPELPLLYDFLGVPDPERPVAVVPGPERQRQLLATLKRLTSARGQREPAVILFEDLHWIDPLTEAFVENLVDAVDGSRTLMVVNFRPEYRAEWMRRSYYQQLALAALDSRAFIEMFDDQLGTDPSLGDLVGRLHARTAGNPFFAEEIVQSLIETGLLHGTRGTYQLQRTSEATDLPVTVHSVLAARIDRLSERDKAVLQSASVIGREFSEAVLRAVMLPPPSPLLGKEGEPTADPLISKEGERGRSALQSYEELAESLQTLVASEFVYETALYPEAEYIFKHPLTQEVAYASQLRERRARIHAALARAIPAQHPDKLDEQAALIAHHWEGAGEALEAARWHARAAEFVGLRDAAGGLQRWRQVRELVSPLPESAAIIELRATAAARIVWTGARTGLPEAEMEQLFGEGLDLARRSANARAEVLLLAGRAFSLGFDGAQVSLNLLREALAVAERSGNTAMKVVASYHMVANHFGKMTAVREGLERLERVIEATGGDPRVGADLQGFSTLIALHCFKAHMLAALGRLREAEEARSKGRTLLAQIDDPITDGMLWQAAVTLAVFRGDGPAAVQGGLRAVEAAERTTNTFQRVTALMSLVSAHVANTDWEAARAVDTEWQALDKGSSFTGLFLFQARARLFLGLGQNEDALRTTDEVLRRAEGLATSGHEASGRLIRAQALLRLHGAAARAAMEAEIQRAVAIVDDGGFEMYRPRVHEIRAELAHFLGDDAARARELREAQRLYTEMGATGHVARLAKELGGEVVA